MNPDLWTEIDRLLQYAQKKDGDPKTNIDNVLRQWGYVIDRFSGKITPPEAFILNAISKVLHEAFKEAILVAATEALKEKPRQTKQSKTAKYN